MSERIETGKQTGSYRPSEDFLAKLAQQPKNKQQSLYAWSEELGHDRRTVQKNMDRAMKLGVLAAYGGDPRAKVERVEVCHFEYKMDPEPQSLAELSIGRANCEAVAAEQATVLDWVEVVSNCWNAYGPPRPAEVRPRAPRAGGQEAPASSAWPSFLPLVAGVAIAGVCALSEFLFPRSSYTDPSAASPSKPDLAQELFHPYPWTTDSLRGIVPRTEGSP